MSSTTSAKPAAAHDVQPENRDGHRNAWILTGYGIFGLTVLSAIAYTVAQYAVR